jgi:exonuclease VII small subunit
MTNKSITLDERLEKLDAQLEHIATAVVKGFERTDKEIESTEMNLKTQIDIYARAVDAYAKQSETYMQEMLALGAKVDRPEKQIEQIAEHLHLKLAH